MLLKTAKWQTALIPLAFALLAIALYWPAQGNFWVLDDYRNIVGNALLNDLLDTLLNTLRMRGLSYLSFAVDIALWGYDPILSRWASVAIHVINGTLVFILIRNLTGTWRTALFVALVFLCHPVQTSTVNYIVQRMVMLSGLFALLAVILADRCLVAKSREGRWPVAALLLSIVCSILSVMAKENTFFLPLAIPLLVWFRGKGQFVADWRRLWLCWLLPPALALLIKAKSLSAMLGSSLQTSFYKDTGQIFYDTLTDFSWIPFRYFLAQFEVFWIYLGLFLAPVRQGFDYCWPIPSLPPSPLQLGTLLLLSAIAWFVCKNRQRYPLTFFGMVWIVLFMAVESTFIALDPIFQHRLYLALIGVVLIVHEQIIARLREQWGQVLAVLLILLCVGMTWLRNGQWHDPVTFWQSNVAAAPRAPRPTMLLAIELFKAGQYAAAADVLGRYVTVHGATPTFAAQAEALYFAGKPADAMAIFRDIKLHEPGFSGAELIKAQWAIDRGDFADAEHWLERVERQDRRNVLGVYLRGLLAERRGASELAVQYYVRAIEYQYLDANVVSLNFSSTYAQWAADRREALLETLSATLAAERAQVDGQPADLNRRGQFANRLLLLGLYKEAIGQYEQLRQLAPPSWQLPYNLGIAYEKTGQNRKALVCYRESVAFSPNSPEPWFNYASLLKRRGFNEQALEIFARLTQQTPGDGKLWIMYGSTLLGAGQKDKAKEAYQVAARIPGYYALAKEALAGL